MGHAINIAGVEKKHPARIGYYSVIARSAFHIQASSRKNQNVTGRFFLTSEVRLRSATTPVGNSHQRAGKKLRAIKVLRHHWFHSTLWNKDKSSVRYQIQNKQKNESAGARSFANFKEI